MQELQREKMAAKREIQMIEKEFEHKLKAKEAQLVQLQESLNI